MQSTSEIVWAAGSAELLAMFDQAWSLLTVAAEDRSAALRLLTVATSTADGPDARTMVLRATGRSTGTLGFYTDRRAAKVEALTRDPRVAVLGYDPVSRVQLRLLGRAATATSGMAVDRVWAAIGEAGRDAYRTLQAPGSPIASSAEGQPAAERSGREDFAVLTVTVERIEWLDLGVAMHRRARWLRTKNGWRGTWLVP